jgi:hypothetical protein
VKIVDISRMIERESKGAVSTFSGLAMGLKVS